MINVIGNYLYFYFYCFEWFCDIELSREKVVVNYYILYDEICYI